MTYLVEIGRPASSRSPATSSTATGRSGRSRRRSGRTAAWRAQESTIVSCARPRRDGAGDLLLPSHGEPIDDPPARARAGARAHAGAGRPPPRAALGPRRPGCDDPFDPVTPHLLRNRTSLANSYVLALRDRARRCCIDFGYDICTGTPSAPSGPPAPLLSSLAALRRDYGVERIEAVVPTHYHDDHVAGLNLLRDGRGRRGLGAGEHRAGAGGAEALRPAVPLVGADPRRPRAAARRAVPLARVRADASTRCPATRYYAAAIAFEVDGKRVLVVGDQEAIEDERATSLNYQYRNRFRHRRLRPRAPSCIAQLAAGRDRSSGHWLPARGDRRATSTGSLADGAPPRRAARRAAAARRGRLRGRGASAPGSSPTGRASRAAGRSARRHRAEPVRPRRDRDRAARRSAGLDAAPPAQDVALAALGEATLPLRGRGRRRVRAARSARGRRDGRRARRFGQQAEALVDVA